MDEKTRQAEQDAEAIRQFIERFALMEQNVKELEAYYQESWMEDVEALEAQAPGEYFYCTNQDAIWNAAQDIYLQKITLLKRLADSL